MNKRIFFLFGIFIAAFLMYKFGSYETEVEQQPLTVEHVREAIDLAENVLDGVESYYSDFKNTPVSNQEAGLPLPGNITSKNVRSVRVYGGIVIVKFKKHLMQGTKFELRPDFSRTQPIKIEWRCKTGKIKRQYFEEVWPECLTTGSDVAMDLLNAVHQSNLEKIEAAVEGGADVNQVVLGNTPLLTAVKRGKVNIVEYLLDNGADIEQTTSTYSGRTPLMVALTNSNRDVVALLIERDADVNAQDPKGKSVLQHVRHDRSFYRKLLIDSGAGTEDQF